MIVLGSIKEQEPDPREGEHAPELYSLSCTSKLGQRVHPWVDLLCLPQQGRSVAGLHLSDSVPRLYLRCAIPTCRNLSKLLQLRFTCIVKEQARPGEQAPEGGARESGVALLRELVGWQGATRTIALACSLPCPEQLKVWRTLPQSTQACSVGGCSLLLQPRFSKASSPGQVITLVCNLNSLGPIHLHGCCTSSRLTACSPDPGVAENGKRTTAERDGGKQAVSSLY